MDNNTSTKPIQMLIKGLRFYLFLTVKESCCKYITTAMKQCLFYVNNY